MMAYIRRFLTALNQEKFKPEKDETMATTKTDNVNVTYLAGVLKFNPSVYDNQTKALIDTGQKKPIPVMVSKNDKALRDGLARFREGDLIKVVAILEPYGVKQGDGSWKNGLAVRITEIKCEIPKREPVGEPKPAQSSNNGNRNQAFTLDDECPF
jgi:hypothetical protein